MATPVIMPRQGQSVESCIITRFAKKIGDVVKQGDLLFTYETDKASFDEEAKCEGKVLGIFFEEGDDVPVLTNVMAIGEEGEAFTQLDPKGTVGGEQTRNAENVFEKEVLSQFSATNNADKSTLENQAPKAENEKSQAFNAGNTSGSFTKDNGRIMISPRARNLAEKSGVDSVQVTGTGPNGRIIERDIRAFVSDGAASKTSVTLKEQAVINNIIKEEKDKATAQSLQSGASLNAEYEEVKLTNIRKVIAKAMHQSLSTTAQLTLNASFDASEILSIRKKLKAGSEKLGISNVTLNDIILFAVSRVLKNPLHRDLNAHLVEDKMLCFKGVHLGIAVDTPRGLLVPTLFNADKMSLGEISREARLLAEDAQKGTIKPDLLKGASFTTTNLGTLDIESFTPVINPPQTGILGINTIIQRAREINGETEFYPAMGLSLTFDHRAVDGAPAARFLKDLKTSLENFTVLLCK